MNSSSISQAGAERPYVSARLDITDRDKAEVLMRLVNAAKYQGLPGDAVEEGLVRGKRMTLAEAREILRRRCMLINQGMRPSLALHFDYVEGKPIKINLSDDTFSPILYDRYHGLGAAAAALGVMDKEPTTQVEASS